MNLPTIPIPWKILFSMLRMGIEMTFAENYGWEMEFTPHPLPLKDSCHSIVVYFVYNCGGNAVSIETDCSTCQIRKTRATLKRKLKIISIMKLSNSYHDSRSRNDDSIAIS